LEDCSSLEMLAKTNTEADPVLLCFTLLYFVINSRFVVSMRPHSEINQPARLQKGQEPLMAKEGLMEGIPELYKVFRNGNQSSEKN